MDDIRLRDVSESDLEVFYAQQKDPEAVDRAKFPAREHEAFVQHWRTKVLGDPTALVQAVTVDDELAGNVVAWWAQDGQRFLGYWLGREFWGRGVGSTSVRLFLDREPTRPIYADPYVGNTSSVRLLEKCGFEHVETLHDDEYDHALLVLH